jgi:hypothetical protein
MDSLLFTVAVLVLGILVLVAVAEGFNRYVRGRRRD